MAGPAPPRRRVSVLGVCLAVLAAAACASCGDRTSGAGDQLEQIGQAYVTALAHLLPAGVPVDDEPLPVLYLWEFTEEPMSLDDQVVVIEHFDDSHDVRFVDQFDAAVDENLPTTPPRDDGLLVGLGPIPVDPPHTIRVEFYEDADRIEAVAVTLVWVDDTWAVSDEAPVEPEAFDVVT